jgi:carbon starvation protein
VRDYYAMNTELAAMPAYHDRILTVAGPQATEDIGVYEERTHESLRGRTGGAVTLAVGMAHIFDGVAQRFASGATQSVQAMWKYWYHFAIMFEALFILTTIDTGTRIGRFLLQEIAGHLDPRLGIRGGWPSAVISTIIIVVAWALFMSSDQFMTIWAMFGIANQMLAVIALAVVSAYVANSGKVRYLWITVVPLCFVMTTTTSAAVQMLGGDWTSIATELARPSGRGLNWAVVGRSLMKGGATLAMLICGVVVVLSSARRIWSIRHDAQEPDAPPRPTLQPAVGK